MAILIVFAVAAFLVLAFAVLAHRGEALLKAEKTPELAQSRRIVRKCASILLPPAVQVELPESGTYCAFVDVETTGLDPHENEIIEFSIILASFDPNRLHLGLQKVVAQYTGLREPSHLIPLAATRVNQITNEMVRGQQLDHQRILDLTSRASFFVAHNASFDRQFSCALIPELDAKPWLCTLRSIDWSAESCARKSLDYLCEQFEIQREAKHRSLHDTLALINLVNTIGTDGLPFFAQILAKVPKPKTPRSQKRTIKAVPSIVTVEANGDTPHQPPKTRAARKKPEPASVMVAPPIAGPKG